MAELERFIREYAERAFQFAFRLCGNAEEAKELTQEAFFRLIRKWDQYDPSQPLEGWFLTVLRNVYYDGLRRHERSRTVPLDAPLLRSEPEGLSYADLLADGSEALLDKIERREAGSRIQEALELLSAEHRAVLTLCDMQGLKYEEIAEVLDCPLGTVRSRVSRARAAFKRMLLERSPEVVEP